jgi:hypothetical protein
VRDELSVLSAFLAVADERSFTKAAKPLTFWRYRSAIAGCRSGRLIRGVELSLQLLPASVVQLDLGFAFIHRDFVVEHQVQELLDPRADARARSPDSLTTGSRGVPPEAGSSRG